MQARSAKASSPQELTTPFESHTQNSGTRHEGYRNDKDQEMVDIETPKG
jgi:hypothetical protein